MKINSFSVVVALLIMGVTAMSAQAATLAAHWAFSEGSGEAGTVIADSGPTGLDMVAVGAIGWGSENGNSYLSLNGTGPHAKLLGDVGWYGSTGSAGHLDTNLKDSGSISGWYKTDNFQSTLFSLSTGLGYSSMGLGNETGSDAGNIAGSLIDANPIGNVAAPTGAWTHAALTWDNGAGVAKLYVNGVQAGSDVAWAAPPAANALSYYPSYIGMAPYAVAGKHYFEGGIDEIKAWSGALSGAEVASEHAAGRGGVIPEPASLALLGMGSLLMLRRRQSA